MQIIPNTPYWVWPLFAFLVVVGLRAARARQVHIGLSLALPILGALSIRTLINLPGYAWLIWLSAICLGAWLGYRLQARWLIARTGMQVQLRGEWMTFTVIMVIFCSNFVIGTVRAIAPEAMTSWGFVTVLSAVLGLCAGSFLGRALYTLRS